MRIALPVLSAVTLLGVAACSNYSGTTATGAKPAGAASTAPMASSQMPQPANSLPPGDAVNAPVSGRVGTVGRTAY